MAAADLTPVRYNEIPEDSILRKGIKPLKRDEKVTYRLYGSYDPSKPNKFTGRTLRVPPTDLIMDPETGKAYDIAMVRGIGAGGVQELDNEVFFEPTAFCQITLKGSNAREVRRYEFFEMCNFNKDNPYRNPSAPIYIERVNEETDRTAKRSKFKKTVAAMEMVENFSEKEVLDFIRANRLPDAGSHQRRLSMLEDLAQKDPDKFMVMPSADHTALLPLIEAAIKAKIIVWNAQTRQYSTFDKRVITTIKPGFAVKLTEALAKFLMSPEGHQDVDWIKAELKKAE